jgi:hypothetical protein
MNNIGPLSDENIPDIDYLKKGFKLLEEGNFREKPYPGKTKIFLDT